MKKFAVLTLAVFLSACGATSEEQERDMTYVQSAMPDGCKLHFAGEVRVEGSGYPSRIFYTTCEGVTTVSENHNIQQGKTSRNQNDVNIVR